MNENKNNNEQVVENETAEETVVEEIFAEEAEKAPETEMMSFNWLMRKLLNLKQKLMKWITVIFVFKLILIIYAVVPS